MFSFKKKENTLGSAAIGEVTPITAVPDEVFSKKILGDGFAVIPTDGNIISPADGTISEVSDTLHAYGITSDDGLEILVHIGLDTVEMRGEGFTPFVKRGDKIKRGAPIAFADISAIQGRGYKSNVIVVITNSERLKNYSINAGIAKNSEYDAMSYKM